jgi:putative tryptophan/tyrosine transport system substrate-binding protein
MKRRDFITLIGVLTLPLIARAQQPVRGIGILMGYAADDTEAQARVVAFTKGLKTLGWNEGQTVVTEYRWAAGDVQRMSALARELVSWGPEVILSHSTPVTAALHRETKSIPIVFVIVSDPIGSGFVETLARPGGNITGFINLESSLVGKWLELIKELAPDLMQVSVMFNPETAPYVDYYLKPMEIAAPKLGIQASISPVRSEADIEDVIARLGGKPNSGLVVMTDSYMFVHRKVIADLTIRYKVPTIHYTSDLVVEGGLMSYGVDTKDFFRRAATYVDRILRGAKPADLPVQQPTKFELAINLKTAAMLGLTVPPSLLARADEVIE